MPLTPVSTGLGRNTLQLQFLGCRLWVIVASSFCPWDQITDRNLRLAFVRVFQVVRRAWQSRGDSFLEGRQGAMSAFAGFFLSRFYSPSIGDGASHVRDESSQPLVFFVSILTH